MILADYVFLDYFYILLPASLVSAVAVAILSSALTTFKYYDNWINYRTICETLKKEKYLYNAEIDEYSSVEDKKALFVQRVEALISRENTLWVTTFKKSEEKVNS